MSDYRHTGRATPSLGERLSMASGVATVLAVVAAMFSAPSHAEGGAAEFAASYASNAGGHLTSTFLSGLASLFFIIFLGGLFSILRRAEGGPGTLARMLLGGGLSLITLVLAGQAAYAASVMVAGGEGVAPGVVRGIDTLAFVTMQFAIFPRVVFIGATALILLRSTVTPRWLGWAGLVVAAVNLVGAGGAFDYEGTSTLGLFAFLSLVVFVLWVLATSIVYLARGGSSVAVPEPEVARP